MSIEAKLEALTAAVLKNIEVTENLIALRTEAIETVKSTAAPKASGKAATTKAADVPNTAAASAAPNTSAAEAPATDNGSAYDEAKEQVATYTKGSDRKEEQQARKEKVRWLLRHPKLVKPELADNTDSFAVTDIAEGNIAAFIKNVKALIEKGDLTQPAEADDSLV